MSAPLAQPPAEQRLAAMQAHLDNLNRKLRTLPVIEQAKGILMARSQCTPDEAFDVLRRASMRSNIKLRDIAAAIVADTCRRPPDGDQPG